MNSSRRKFAAILEALGMPSSARRNAATPAAPACESLEGRQLLTGGMDLAGLGIGLGMPSMGVADVGGLGFGGGSTLTQATAGLGGASNAQLQADTQKLQADTQTIQDQSLVTPAMTSAVDADVNAVKAGITTTPNAGAVANLKAVTAAANASPGGPTIGQTFGVEIAQNIVYISEGVSLDLITKLDNDEMAVMMATGITGTEEATLAADHAAIAADTAKATPFTTAGTMIPAGSTTTTPVTTAGTMIPAGSTTMPTAMMATPVPFGAAHGAIAASSVAVPGELAAAGAGDLITSSTGGQGMSPMGGLGLSMLGGQTSTSSTTSATLTTALTTLKAAMQQLQTDTQAVQANSHVTPGMEAVISNDLETIRGAVSTSPSATAVANLKADITTAQTNGGGPTAAQIAQVQTDRDAVLASEGVNTALISKLESDLAIVKSSSGITPAQQAAIVVDQVAVSGDEANVKAALPAPTSTTTTTTTTNPTTPGLDWNVGGKGFGPARLLP